MKIINHDGSPWNPSKDQLIDHEKQFRELLFETLTNGYTNGGANRQDKEDSIQTSSIKGI
jgi:hypothetical protein